LNIGGLTTDWKNRFFELLFNCETHKVLDPYTPILTELYNFPRLKGDHILAFSFVSKLVAIHDESRPIFDAHVSNFFGLRAPSIGPTEHRISGFLANLNYIQKTYEAWSIDHRFTPLLKNLTARYSDLSTCHHSRLCDFLVWTIGRMNIGKLSA
jgi:hypothetical protein